jgi:hypothetical protein
LWRSAPAVPTAYIIPSGSLYSASFLSVILDLMYPFHYIPLDTFSDNYDCGLARKDLHYTFGIMDEKHL